MPMRLTRAPMPSNFGITALAYLAPVSSLSGQTMTVLPASGDQSVVSSAVAALCPEASETPDSSARGWVS